MKTDILQGRVALVTGGASGIGLAIARKLFEAGSHVAIADVNLDRAEAAIRDFPARDAQQKIALQVDMSDTSSILQMVSACEGRLGTVDILVNNAGFQHVAPIETFPPETFRKLIDVMLVGPFVATQAVFAKMKQRRWGRIINISSINGKIGAPFKAGYCSAKHGIIGLTRVTAVEAGDSGVTCNAICPGFVDTPLVRNQLADLGAAYQLPPDRVLDDAILQHVPQKRLLDAAEIGDFAVFLASDAAAAITGQSINISGGYVMH
ncbi:3-hydroxybutyrate dehydrogenase [Brevibacillus sp. SYP-B805]|uniref:3-hydroxybutyrate dehydrogenase n=1 Tax=Brevibacillus sp. SYP-B805 TaxID=1578199 RepID=UPI0013ECD10B|nr:3-hydroxybutyrate dehydrogenase [Brevibacillus sp. SYP-B805]NGQ94078.1 3-hydroxybutyrate dehydrogenase [Brevibacillus sp. SYP-B805]